MMDEFLYFVSFYIEDNYLHIEISVKVDNLIVPAYKRSFDSKVLDDKTEFEAIYNNIIEYFSVTRLNMTKTDLSLFYNTIKKFNLILPDVASLTILTDRVSVKNDLSPKEVLLLLYLDGKKVNSKKAKYLEEFYHIDIDYSIKRLCEAGFLSTEDYLYNLSKVTKKDLLELLEEKNNALSKPELVNMVKERFTTQELKHLFCGTFYKLTDKGLECKESWETINDFNNSYYRFANNLRIDEFYLLSIKYSSLNTKDVCKIMVQNKGSVNKSDFDWDKFFNEVSEKVAKQSDKPLKNEDYSNTIDDAFNRILQKYSNKDSSEVKSISDDEFQKVINKKKIEKKEPVFEELKVQPPKKHIIETKTTEDISNSTSVFFGRFVISSLLCVLVIYSLYSYIFD